MADERVTLTRRVSGGAFLKVAATVVEAEGQRWLEGEILARGLVPADLGPAKRRGSNWEIPIRREET